MPDFVDLMEERLKAVLESENAYVEYELFEDEEDVHHGAFAVLDEQDEILLYEFFETAASCMRPEAIGEYNEAAEKGIPVSVVVPDEAIAAVSDKVQRNGHRFVAVIGYSATVSSDRRMTIPMPE